MIVDVGIEFRPKISKGRRYRVETQLTVTAQGPGLHIHSNILHQSQVFRCAFQSTKTLQNL